MRSKKLALLIVLLFIATAVLAGCGSPSKPVEKSSANEPAAKEEPKEEAKKTFLAFAGGPSGTAGMASMAALAGYLNKQVTTINVTAETSGGSVENVKRVNDERADYGMAFSADLFEGYNGSGQYESQAQSNIRAMGVGYLSYVHLITLKGSGITSVADLKGKKVGVGAQGSGSCFLSERLYKQLGIWDSIKPSYIGSVDAMTALKDGQIDACLNTPGIPWGAFVDLASTKDVVFLDVVGEAEKAGFFKEYPYYFQAEIPGGTYKGFDQATPVIATAVVFMVGKHVPENIVYDITKACYSKEGVDSLSGTMKSLGDMGNEKIVLSGINIPLHVGAEKYWKERGLTIPDALKAK